MFAASTPALAQDAPRLLTGLTAEAGSDGVALAWTVDESRADRVAGFGCVFRTPGHLFRDRRRWALAGDVVLESGLVEGRAQLSGRIENVVLAALDAKSVEPAAGAPGRLPDFVLEAGPAEDAGWSGAVRFAAWDSSGAPEGFPGADSFQDDWHAAAHGPDGQEIAGRLRLWTPLAAGADPATDWPGQAVLVAGFGGARTP